MTSPTETVLVALMELDHWGAVLDRATTADDHAIDRARAQLNFVRTRLKLAPLVQGDPVEYEYVTAQELLDKLAPRLRQLELRHADADLDTAAALPPGGNEAQQAAAAQLEQVINGLRDRETKLKAAVAKAAKK
jgi:hypothetical protein